MPDEDKSPQDPHRTTEEPAGLLQSRRDPGLSSFLDNLPPGPTPEAAASEAGRPGPGPRRP